LSASSPPPLASLWASTCQPSSLSPFPSSSSSSPLHRLHCSRSIWTVESAPLFTRPDKSGPAQNEWVGSGPVKKIKKYFQKFVIFLRIILLNFA
jgi:hypothetical protein